jgi:tetratricopeptide (TPR) repeat protein
LPICTSELTVGLLTTAGPAALSCRVLWRALRMAILVALPAVAAWVWARTRDPTLFWSLGGIWLVFGLLPSGVPRMAHRAFRRGAFGRAALGYGLLRRVSLDPGARGSLEICLAACDLARGRPGRALERLDRMRTDRLPAAARAAWLNNRAYALVRDGRDADEALEHIDEAVALRPEVPGFRHTRGIALLAAGRPDDAIRELDSLWGEAGDEHPPLLEAERCYDLARAWRRKGEPEYAADYFQRARRAAPGTTWAERADDGLTEVAPRPAALPDFLEA